VHKANSFLSVERFIADRISNPRQNKGNISKPIVKIGIIGISVGVCVMLLAVSIVLGFKKEIVNRITGLTTHITVSSVTMNASNEPEPIGIGPDTLTLIKKYPFVSHVQPTAFKNGLLKTDTDNEGILLKGVTADYDFSFIKEHLLEGNLPSFKDNEPSKDILISHALAEKMNLRLEDKLLVYFISQHEIYDNVERETIVKSEQRSRKLTVCGIFKTDFSDFDEKLSIVDLRQIQKLNYWDSSMVGAYEIRVRDFETVDEDVSGLQDLLGYDYNIRSVKDIYSNIFTWLDKLDLNGVIIVVLMILVATINMITALLILILERANMVGMVKAFGMNNGAVRKIFLFISFKLVGRGMLWGNVAGIGLCLLQYYFRIFTMNGETYYVDYVAIDINWWYFLLLNLGTFVTCAVMLFLPTLILTKLTPIKTLKFD
jgi:lipoprotein-releasing system permease protein